MLFRSQAARPRPDAWRVQQLRAALPVGAKRSRSSGSDSGTASASPAKKARAIKYDDMDVEMMVRAAISQYVDKNDGVLNIITVEQLDDVFAQSSKIPDYTWNFGMALNLISEKFNTDSMRDVTAEQLPANVMGSYITVEGFVTRFMSGVQNYYDSIGDDIGNYDEHDNAWFPVIATALVTGELVLTPKARMSMRSSTSPMASPRAAIARGAAAAAENAADRSSALAGATSAMARREVRDAGVLSAGAMGTVAETAQALASARRVATEAKEALVAAEIAAAQAKNTHMEAKASMQRTVEQAKQAYEAAQRAVKQAKEAHAIARASVKEASDAHTSARAVERNAKQQARDANKLASAASASSAAAATTETMTDNAVIAAEMRQ